MLNRAANPLNLNRIPNVELILKQNEQSRNGKKYLGNLLHYKIFTMRTIGEYTLIFL